MRQVISKLSDGTFESEDLKAEVLYCVGEGDVYAREWLETHTEF